MCGGREYADTENVWRVLGKLHETEGVLAVAHGGAHGADSEAGSWANAMKISVRVYPADWMREGKAAGPRRNQKMLIDFRPDAVVAFPGGRGTADLVRRAHEEGIRVIPG